MKRLQEILAGSWAIAPKDYEAFCALLLPCIVNGNIDRAEALFNKTSVKAYATSSANIAEEWELGDDALPDSSVAVIMLEGVLFSWETYRLERLLAQVEANPRICGAVLWINGPGGMVAHVDVVAAMLRDMTKPTATFVAGTMASAHFWIGTATDRTFVASPLCDVGSVGVMVTWASFKEFFKKSGIDVRDIYPDTADLKNFELRALEDEGDEQPIKQHLEALHKIFAETVATNLGVDYDPELPLFRGQLFTGAEAVALGYINQTGTLLDAIGWVLGRATAMMADALTN